MSGESQDPEYARQRISLKSEGHQRPRFVDKPLPTEEATIQAEGGPGRSGDGQGSLPWVCGSITIGSGQVLNLQYMHWDANTPNWWVKLRHNHSGTSAVVPEGGTLDAYHQNQAGRFTAIGDVDSPLRSIKGPGTLTAELFGPRNRLTSADGTVPHGSLGTNPSEAWSVTIRGYMV